MKFYPKQPTLQITLSETHITIQTPNKPILKQALIKQEFFQGIINNPTFLAQTLSNYINQHDLRNPCIEVQVAEIASFSPQQQPFMVLQIALCLGLPSGRLTKITAGNDDKNYLSLISTKTYSPKSWLFGMGLIGLIGIGSAFASYFSQKRLTDTTQQKIQHVQQQLDHRLQQQKALELLRKRHETLQEKTAILSEHTTHQARLIHMLSCIAQTIPNNTILTKLLIEPIKANHKISIHGSSLQAKSVSYFLRRLRQKSGCQDLAINSIYQSTDEQGQSRYLFSFFGTI